MKKMCRVCGNVVERDIKECPNCGSYDFEPVKEEQKSSDRFRRFV